MSFARTCLSVCQDSRVIPLEHRLDLVLRCVGVDLLLGVRLVIDIVKAISVPDAEVRVTLDILCFLPLVVFLAQVLHYLKRSIVLAHLSDPSKTVSCLLSLQWWSHSYLYLKVAVVGAAIGRHHALGGHWKGDRLLHEIVIWLGNDSVNGLLRLNVSRCLVLTPLLLEVVHKVLLLIQVVCVGLALRIG